MKIRAIRLFNVRRFAGCRAEITGISDGVTTICEPNETGKSTFFDALHAVLFFDHKSTAAEVRSLQPYAKGAVEITTDIELPTGHFQITKRFLSAKSASITDLGTGRIIAQEGEAEAWIDAAMGADIKGPAGLLWVRQGVTGFGPEGSGAPEKREREAQREARQTLMSTVAGHIDSVTGGRRMDTIMKSVSADLDALATKALAPKASGEWGRATARVSELEQETSILREQVAELAAALGERTELKAKLADPRAAQDDSDRKAQIRSLDAQIETAREHDRQIEQAAKDLRIAELELSGIDQEIDEIATHIERLKARELAVHEAETKLQSTKEIFDAEHAAYEIAQKNHGAAHDRLKLAQTVANMERKNRDRKVTEKRRAELTEQLQKAQVFSDQLNAAQDRLSRNPVDAAAMAHLDDLLRRRTEEEAHASARAASFRVRYEGDMRITTERQIIESEQEYAITEAISLTLPGIGTMDVSAGFAPGADEKVNIDEHIRKTLETLGVPTVEKARSAHAMQEVDKKKADDAKIALDVLAGNGIDALRAELAALPAPADEPLPSPPASELTADAAQEQEAMARDALETARTRREAAHGRYLQAQTAQKLAVEAFQRDPVRSPPNAEQMQSKRAAASRKVDTARGAHQSLLQAAPDLETLTAAHDRLVSARDNAQKRRQKMQQRVSELDGRISVQAGDRVEERLAEAQGMLEKARARADRYAFDVQVLNRLRRELEHARSSARDAYFEPVKAELGPLLAMLHQGAEVEMDSDTMLPAGISRNGVMDDFDALSGGASEQIAILTRLAFARLYANQGRDIPVILDDALVHSDDDRIVKMFTALTRISRDQQIIVFSCRTRAFEDLGGHRPQISIQSN